MEFQEVVKALRAQAQIIDDDCVYGQGGDPDTMRAAADMLEQQERLLEARYEARIPAAMVNVINEQGDKIKRVAAIGCLFHDPLTDGAPCCVVARAVQDALE